MPSEQPTKPSLGRLEKIDPSQYWENDESELTQWLTQDDNIQLLGEAIGVELEVVLDAGQVEELQSDLLCRDILTGEWVLIGNQLSPTDEAYLGRLLTYAADVNASTIVWVSTEFLPEHQTVLKWLDQVTQSTVQFFALELELWRIGDAAMAATFNRIIPPIPPASAERPLEKLPTSLHEAAASLGEGIELDGLQNLADSPDSDLEDDTSEEPPAAEAVAEPLSETEQQNLDFWVTLCDQLERRGSIVKPSAPVTGDYIGFTIGRAGFRLYAAIDREHESLQAGLRLFDEDAQAYFGLLLTRQDLVEAELESSLVWDDQTDSPSCFIYMTRPHVAIEDEEAWPEYIGWLCESLEQLHETFSERVKVLNAFDYRKPLGDFVDPLQDLLVLPDQI